LMWAAAAIDAAIGGGALLAMWRGVVGGVAKRPTVQGFIDAVHDQGVVLALPFVVVGVLWLTFFYAIPAVLGSSIGQRVCGAELSLSSGKAPSLARRLARAPIAAVTALPFAAGPLFGLLVQRDRRSLADLLTGVVVARRDRA
jgi:uncharacterized RDD family membrane protein YckC